MEVRSYKPDDPELTKHIADSRARPLADNSRPLPPAPYSPIFGDYIAGKTDKAEEIKVMAERAEADEVETLPDGRQIQIKAKGAPVNEKLVERERELVESTRKQMETTDPLREIEPDAGTHALGTGVREATVRPLTGSRTVSEDKTAKK
jgi:hypothetical protein